MIPLRLLLVEDSDDDARLVIRQLERGGFRVAWKRVQEEQDLRAAMSNDAWDLVISDWTMPQFGALGALAVVRELRLDLPFIIVSGTVGEDTAVLALRAGAHDFLLKDGLTRLVPAIERELRDAKERDARRRAEENLRRTEEQLRQAQKMEAIGSLAGGVAHDFNNLLSVILTCSGLALEGLSTDDPRRHEIEQVIQAGQRAADLTRQLLAFGRKQVLQPRVVDLSQVLAGMETMLRRLLGESVEVSILPSQPHARVFADPGQLEQVILNLAVNARDAMPRGGKLSIVTRNVAANEDAAGDPEAAAGGYVLLAVTDTGIGMAPEVRARVFEPFFTTKEEGRGTGLGLSTVFGIVKQSGGHIAVDSEPGKGSTFRVYLPQTQKRDDLRTPPPPPATLRGSETVLVVDDDDLVRRAMANVLRRQGYQVFEAQNGGEALLVCEQETVTIHLLVTDVAMPRLSGPELAARLERVRPGLKMLFVSGYAKSTLTPDGVLDPAVSFLQKPFAPDALARKVREILDSR